MHSIKLFIIFICCAFITTISGHLSASPKKTLEVKWEIAKLDKLGDHDVKVSRFYGTKISKDGEPGSNCHQLPVRIGESNGDHFEMIEVRCNEGFSNATSLLVQCSIEHHDSGGGGIKFVSDRDGTASPDDILIVLTCKS